MGPMCEGKTGHLKPNNVSGRSRGWDDIMGDTHCEYSEISWSGEHLKGRLSSLYHSGDSEKLGSRS